MKYANGTSTQPCFAFAERVVNSVLRCESMEMQSSAWSQGLSLPKMEAVCFLVALRFCQPPVTSPTKQTSEAGESCSTCFDGLAVLFRINEVRRQNTNSETSHCANGCLTEMNNVSVAIPRFVRQKRRWSCEFLTDSSEPQRRWRASALCKMVRLFVCNSELSVQNSTITGKSS